MQLSLYNEDNYEYFGIIDVPDDVAKFLILTSEQEGYTVEEFVYQLIMEIINDRMQGLDSNLNEN